MAQSDPCPGCPCPSDSLRTLHLDEIVVQSRPELPSLSRFYQTSQLAQTEDLLARMPACHLIRRGSFGMEPLIRGLSAGQINVRIDGMAIFSACTDKMDPVTVYVEPNNLKNLEIKTGTRGSEWGATIGGSVHLQTQDPVLNADRPWMGKIGTGFQSAAQSWQHQLNFNYTQRRLGLRLNGVYRQSQPYRAGNGQTIAFSQFNKANLGASLKYRLNEQSLLKASVLLDEAWDMGYPALPMDVAFARARIYGLAYELYPAKGKLEFLETKVYFNQIHHLMDDTQRPEVQIHMDMPGWSKTGGAYLHTEWALAPQHQLKARLDFYQNVVRAEMTMYPEGEAPMFMLTWPDARRSVGAVFLAYQGKISSRLLLEAQTRLDYALSRLTSAFGRNQLAVFGYAVEGNIAHVLPTVHLGLRPASEKKWQWRANLGYGQRAPTVSEMFGFYLYNRLDGFDYLGLPTLKTEASWQMEASLHHRTKKGATELSLFYHYLPAYILADVDPNLSAMTPGARGVKVYQHIPFAQLLGAELQTSQTFGTHWQWVGQWKFTLGQDHRAQALPLIPPLKSIQTLRYQRPRWSLQIEQEAALSQTRFREDFGENQTPAFMIFHLRGSYHWQFRTQSIELSGGIENLTDQPYWEHLDWIDIPRPGLNLYLNLFYRF
ncbi:MAG: TonB-dependent receptor [Microscillaceae bacterium]|nr:TonB-dependent receptor [Microscillaceae bacterium]